MIIDSHAHVVMPEAAYRYMGAIISNRANPMEPAKIPSDEVMGVDNCLFGTERPGTGSAFNAEWGHDFDDLKPVIESIDWLTAEDKFKLFEGNAKKLYPHAFAQDHHGHKHK